MALEPSHVDYIGHCRAWELKDEIHPHQPQVGSLDDLVHVGVGAQELLTHPLVERSGDNKVEVNTNPILQQVFKPVGKGHAVGEG